MMSFGGGWFFLAASEAISVLNRQYTLPGIGSYVAAAIEARNLKALEWAILTMVIVILVIDQLFWKPLVTLADRYKLELSAGEERHFWLVDLWRAASLPRYMERFIWPGVARLRQSALPLDRGSGGSKSQRWIQDGRDRLQRRSPCHYRGALDCRGAICAGRSRDPGSRARGGAGLATLSRVIALLIFSTLVWTPIGVAIGFHPKLARVSQPLIQILASFPANFLFPFATLGFIKMGVSLNWGSMLLMALGAQWYLLFNVIGGAQSIPNDLREMASSIGLRRGRAWRALIGPGIFGSWVTGAITASGGAWNASYRVGDRLLGQQDVESRRTGVLSSPRRRPGETGRRIVLGVGLMSIFVVTLNRLVWRPLYNLAETQISIGVSCMEKSSSSISGGTGGKELSFAGRRGTDGAGGSLGEHSSGRGGGAAGPQRVGQEHAAAYSCRFDRAEPGTSPGERDSASGAERGRCHGVSELRSLAMAHSAGEASLPP